MSDEKNTPSPNPSTERPDTEEKKPRPRATLIKRKPEQKRVAPSAPRAGEPPGGAAPVSPAGSGPGRPAAGAGEDRRRIVVVKKQRRTVVVKRRPAGAAAVKPNPGPGAPQRTAADAKAAKAEPPAPAKAPSPEPRPDGGARGARPSAAPPTGTRPAGSPPGEGRQARFQGHPLRLRYRLRRRRLVPPRGRRARPGRGRRHPETGRCGVARPRTVRRWATGPAADPILRCGVRAARESVPPAAG